MTRRNWFAETRWLLWLGIVFVSAGIIDSVLSTCSYPLRFDPKREQLERKQEQCLVHGGNPQECRP